MAIFGKSDHKGFSDTSTKPEAKTTVISEGSSIKGELKFEGSVYIDGTVEGNIDCGGTITVGKKGKVKGDVKTDKIIISGIVEGTVNCNSIEILSGGRFSGEVEFSEIVIEPKGIFEGTSKLKTGTTVTKKESVAKVEKK